jgi:RHS repeat-associated protein
VHGAGLDEPLVVYDGSGTTNKTWLHADERGSIIAASNASGVAGSSVKYTSDGDSGTLPAAFGYTGQLYLPELQLYYYKARMYSPKAGRFPQPDPIGYADGMNLYAYVGNDPVNSRDPFGLWKEADDCIPGSCIAGPPGVYIDQIVPNYCDSACQFHGQEQARMQRQSERSGADDAPRFEQAQWIPRVIPRLLPRLIPKLPRIPPPPAGQPKPPGWTPEWQWRYPESGRPVDPRWFDPKGGEWRWHIPDKWHQRGHWDYNPWEQWNSPWQNVTPGMPGAIFPGDNNETRPEPFLPECYQGGLCV